MMGITLVLKICLIAHIFLMNVKRAMITTAFSTSVSNTESSNQQPVMPIDSEISRWCFG